MITTLKTAPTVKPVSVSEAKTHMRIDFSFDDTYIGVLISAATNYVENILRRKLITQTWTYFMNAWPDGNYYELPYGQLQSITSVKYVDADDTVNTDFDEDDEFTVDTDSDPGRIVLKYGEVWPNATLATENPIYTEYVCGYGAAGTDVPESIIQAIKILVADMYEVREDHVVGMTVTAKLDTVDNLLYPYRLFGF